MALVKCPQCGADISDLATRCPRCGIELHPAANTTAVNAPAAASAPAAPASPAPTKRNAWSYMACAAAAAAFNIYLMFKQMEALNQMGRNYLIYADNPEIQADIAKSISTMRWYNVGICFTIAVLLAGMVLVYLQQLKPRR
ncbi:MAG: hypothetical protein J6K38_01615 [Alistipes sp.]|nr:hypothetical protein [Alistipes sp.]